MTSPQLENGYIRIANELWEHLGCFRLSGEEWLILNCVIRKTYGFQKKEDHISLSQFQEYTKINRPAVIRAIKKLVSKKILCSIKKDTRQSNLYWFNKLYQEWIPSIKKDTTHSTSINKDNDLVSKKIPELVSKKIHTKEILKDNIQKTIIHKNVLGFGNPDINELMVYFLKVMQLPKEDCPQGTSRQYWFHLLRESKTGVAGVKWLIDQAHNDEWYKNNITSSKDLYYKRVKLIARKRGEIPKVAVMPKEAI